VKGKKMSKEPSKLWLGFTAGMTAGVLIARNPFSKRRMPNARDWQQIFSEEGGQI